MIAFFLAAALAAAPAFTPSKERVGLWEKAEKKLAATPDDPKVIIEAALTRKMVGRYDEALTLLRSCKHMRCGMLLAVFASMTDDAPKMLGFLEKMANDEEQSPDDLSASLRMYSQALVRSGKPDEAVASARKAIAVKDAPAMRLDLAIALFANGQVAEAEKELDPLVARKSDHGATLYWKYRCLKSRKNDKEALTVAVEARDALTAEVDDKLMDRGDLHFLLAELSTDLGDQEAAQEERAIAAALHVTRHWPAKK